MLPTFDIPAFGPRQAKIWGTTQLFFAYNGTESHGIMFDAGAFCSKHRHENKWNRFVVLSGRLKVAIFRENGKVDETTISAGMATDVPPGVWHRFEGLSEGTAIEYYWTTLDPRDIERETEGGRKDGK